MITVWILKLLRSFKIEFPIVVFRLFAKILKRNFVLVTYGNWKKTNLFLELVSKFDKKLVKFRNSL